MLGNFVFLRQCSSRMSKTLTISSATLLVGFTCIAMTTQQQREEGKGMMQIQWVGPCTCYYKLTRNGLIHINITLPLNIKHINDNNRFLSN